MKKDRILKLVNKVSNMKNTEFKNECVFNKLNEFVCRVTRTSFRFGNEATIDMIDDIEIKKITNKDLDYYENI